MRKSKFSDEALHLAVLEMSKGLIDAKVGRGLYKKRLALAGRGKRGSARTILATNTKDRWFFLFGFQKNERENMTQEELEALQQLSSEFLGYSDSELNFAIHKGKLLEVCYDH